MREPVPTALKRFIWDIQSMVELAESEREILVIGRDLMARLVAADDWLPVVFATSGTETSGSETSGAEPFRQFQLYGDGMERFCVVSTVMPGGQSLPLCREPAWEICGVLRGDVARQRFTLPDGAPPVARGAAVILKPGDVDTFSPKGADGLQMVNAAGTADAIVIQVYGGEIGNTPRRTVGPDGRDGTFTTAYANPPDAPAYDILSIQTAIID